MHSARTCPKEGASHLRVLINELGGIVDDIVDNQVKILLGVVLGNVLVGELGGHLDGRSACATCVAMSWMVL